MMLCSRSFTAVSLFGLSALLLLIDANTGYGQAGLRESLERLDTNNDGEIEPDEITPLARPFLEQIAEARRLSLGRPNRIDKLQEASRIYHAIKNGVEDDRVRPDARGSIMEFGRLPDEPLVPEFGLAEVKYPYTQDDLDFADRTLRSHDENNDGMIDRAEAVENKWTHRDPWDDDLNKDDRLSRMELAQRYARRRLLRDDRDELVQRIRRVGTGIESSRPQDRDREDRSQWSRKGGSSYWLSASVLSRFDENKNGRLESSESKLLGLPIAQIDIDRDGELSRDELHAFLTPIQEESASQFEGIPGWFYELDTNQDEQVDMAEFTDEWSEETLQEFLSLDANEDGLLTAFEVANSKSAVGGSYSNEIAEVLPPGRTIISEIEISEDFLVGDLNVQLSITHSSVGVLDAYLTGPDGQRVELFTEVGGRDDHFDQTIFDDQSRYPITKARPPFNGTFMPEALLKRQPSLSSFNGRSVQGVWQLVIRGTRSERFGMLHEWRLIVKPMEEIVGVVEPPEQDGPRGEPSASVFPGMRSPLPSGEDRLPQGDPRTSVSVQSYPQRSPQEMEAFGNKMKDAIASGKLTASEARAEWGAFKSGLKDNKRYDKLSGDQQREKSPMSREMLIERLKAMRGSQ
tara:strand:+ start:148365 stop:150260 length:1896 start_codon:yes stop_codon:yes gene_type:complete